MYFFISGTGGFMHKNVFFPLGVNPHMEKKLLLRGAKTMQTLLVCQKKKDWPRRMPRAIISTLGILCDVDRLTGLQPLQNCKHLFGGGQSVSPGGGGDGTIHCGMNGSMNVGCVIGRGGVFFSKYQLHSFFWRERQQKKAWRGGVNMTRWRDEMDASSFFLCATCQLRIS